MQRIRDSFLGVVFLCRLDLEFYPEKKTRAIRASLLPLRPRTFVHYRRWSVARDCRRSLVPSRKRNATIERRLFTERRANVNNAEVSPAPGGLSVGGTLRVSVAWTLTFDSQDA